MESRIFSFTGFPNDPSLMPGIVSTATVRKEERNLHFAPQF